MSLLQVETFCGYFSLRTGALVIGYLELVFHLITGMLLITILLSPIGMLLLLATAFSACLLIGVYKNKSSYVKVYFLYSAMMLMLVLFDNSPDLDFSFLKEIVLLISMYFLLVIKSYYYTMIEELPICEKPAPIAVKH